MIEWKKEELRDALEQALKKLELEKNVAFCNTLRPILFTTLERKRIQAYLENTGLSPEEYVRRVAKYYEDQYEYVSTLQEVRDNQAWTKVYVTLNQKAYQYYVSYGQTSQHARELAEEAANETATRILNTHFPYDVNFTSWMYTILRNVCLAWLKKIATHPAESLTDFQESLTDSTMHTGRKLEDRMDQREKLLKAIHKLTLNRQQVIMLHYFENLSFEEIAKRMGKTISAIHQLHLQARRDLEKLLRRKRF